MDEFQLLVVTNVDYGNFTSGFSLNHVIRMSTCTGLKDVCEMDSLRISTVYPQNSLNLNVRSWGLSNPDDDMCQIDDKDDLMVGASVKLKSIIVSDDLNKVKKCYHVLCVV